MGDVYFTPRRVKELVGGLAELEAGRWPRWKAPGERARGHISWESKPPSQTFAVLADIAGAIERLPLWERQCCYAFAAALGGGPWDHDFQEWHRRRGCADECRENPRGLKVYWHMARYLARRNGAVCDGLKLACCRIMLLLGGEPDQQDQADFADQLAEVGWVGP